MGKKFDLQNPAANIIGGSVASPEASPQPESRTAEAAGGSSVPAGYKIDHRYVETKSRRLQILLQPSLYGRVKARAEAEGASVNETISRLLLEGLEKLGC